MSIKCLVYELNSGCYIIISVVIRQIITVQESCFTVRLDSYEVLKDK